MKIDYTKFKSKNLVTPRLEIFTSRIAENAKSIIKQCHEAGVSVACVTKVLSGNPEVARTLVEAGADLIADSRIENLLKLRQEGLTGPFMLLRLPTISRAQDVVKAADISLNSNLQTIKALGKAASTLGKIHSIIIMIDVGDLREGIWPDKAPELVTKASKIEGIEVIGIGCNLACYGGVMPSGENMRLLVDTVDKCRNTSELALPVICGGNSSGLPIMMERRLPNGINLYRMGEAIILGRNVIDRSAWEGTRQDTVVCVTEVIESEIKPSMPIGNRGQDAFGGSEEFVDRGLRQRVICNIGRQDVIIDGIKPTEEGIIILGGSSDHLILDVTDSERKIGVGDEISFYPNYGALLALSTSEYVEKVIINE